MPLHIIEKGNIFKVFKNEKQIITIAHGCNMQGVMGAGIAKQIKEKFYPSYVRYNKACSYLTYNELLRLSYTSDYNVMDQTYPFTNVAWNVFNLFIQKETGPNANINFIIGSVYNMLDECVTNGINDIVIPAIGCGIGGLTFDLVSQRLQTIMDVYDEFKDVNLYLIKEFEDIETFLN